MIKDMEITLTKAQYQTLLPLVYCGEWVLNSYKTREDIVYKETDRFEQYVFSLAKENGLEKWIEYDEESGKYFPTALMEEDLHKFIDRYNKRQREM
jgi:hypothetical protein